MNQILSVKMNKRNRNSGQKVEIKKIIIFFTIMLIIFGVALILIGLMLNNNGKNESKNGATDKTGITIEAVQKDISTVTINVESKNNLQGFAYKWDNSEETQVNANNENQMSNDITIPVGDHLLEIVATDVNGNTKTYQKTYTGAPKINLKQDGNTISLECNSDVSIDSITYKFDEGEEQAQQVGSTQASIPIDIKQIEGKHNLTISIKTQDGKQYDQTKEIYIPVVNVVTDQQNFIINAQDERGIAKVTMNFNGQTSEFDVNNTTYTTNLQLQQGENRLIIVVTNNDDVSTTKRIRFVK